jgi:hypothetical protein
MIKKFVIVFSLITSIITSGHAVDVDLNWTWTGASLSSTKYWDDPMNWSGGNGTFPQTFTDVSGFPSVNYFAYVNINSSATITFRSGQIFEVALLNISSGITILETQSGALARAKLTTKGKSISDICMTIGAGGTLTIGNNDRGLLFIHHNGIANISGILEIAGTNANISYYAGFEHFNTSTSYVTNVLSGGKIKFSGVGSVMNGTVKTTLNFASGATLWINREAVAIPPCTFNPGSNLQCDYTAAYNSSCSYGGDIHWNATTQVGALGSFSWAPSASGGANVFSGTFFMQAGSLRFTGAVNTSSFAAIIVTGGSMDFKPTTASTFTTGSLTISSGFFGISGVGSGSSSNVTANITGNLTQSGGTIDLATAVSNGVINVSGNVIQTGGIITESGTSPLSKLAFTGGNAQTAECAAGGLTGDALSVEVNKSANDVMMLSNVTIPKDLILTANNLNVGSNNITINNLATGGKATSHVITPNNVGKLTIKAVNAVGKDFPVGISAASYDPVIIKNTTGTNDFSVSVGSTITSGVPSTYLTVIPRQWEIESPLSAGATLAFTPGVGSASSAKIGHYIGGAWDLTTSSTTSAPTYTGTFTSFSPFIIASQVLPVELVSFTAKKAGTINVLNWQTASEKNNSHFDIERSINGEYNWTSIGTVKGNGNSIVTQNYAFTDKEPLSISYYRLKQIDFDGRFEYSNVVSVIGKSGKFNIASVAPNPTKETSTILFESAKNESVLVTLTDISGRVVLTQNLAATEGVNTINVNMSLLSNGLYIMSLRNNEQVLIQKLTKQ